MKPHESILRTFLELHPSDAARAFESLTFDDAFRTFKRLPTSVASQLLDRLSPILASDLLKKIEVSAVVELVNAVNPRKASAIVQLLQEEKRNEVLDQLPASTARILRHLAEYPTDTAGAIMQPAVASIREDVTAQQAISAIRKTPREVLHYLYVTDAEGKLVGVLNMRDLLLAPPREPIKNIIITSVVSVPDTAPRQEVVQLMQERKYLALPVVDYDGRLVGAVRHTDALQAGQAEAFEDLQKLVGAGAIERAMSPVRLVVRSRLPWLYVNLGTAFMAAAVVGLFEGMIAEVAALAVLLPVVAGQGGNTGSQSLAIVMRGIALREIIPGLARKVVTKEFIASLINGVSVAVVTAAAVLVWRVLKGDPAEAYIGLALVIGLAMIVNMVAAALAGTVIPLALKAMGRDPAQSAAIFLTTVTDIIGFAAFLGLAAAFWNMIH